MEEEITTIQINKNTRKRLRELGKKGETYDKLLNRVITQVKQGQNYDKTRHHLPEHNPRPGNENQKD